MCSNPDCQRLLAGPDLEVADGYMRLGQIAHIAGNKDGSARYDASMTPGQRAAAENGLLLCGHCHDHIDKNNGASFTVSMLQEWRESHEKTVRMILENNRPFMPYVIRLERDTQVAQQVLDFLNTRDALTQQELFREDWWEIVRSFLNIKKELADLAKSVEVDRQITKHILSVQKQVNTFLRSVKVDRTTTQPKCGIKRAEFHLEEVRDHIGDALGALAVRYDLDVPHPLSTILPRQLKLGTGFRP